MTIAIEKTDAISFGRRTAMLAEEHPDKVAIVFARTTGEEEKVSWRTLECESNKAARLLQSQGVAQSSMIVVGLRNSPEHFYFTFGAWKLGACPLPVSPDLPQRERDQILELADPRVVVAELENIAWTTIFPSILKAGKNLSNGQHPDRISNPGKAIGSGGSTGRPKIIVNPGPWVRTVEPEGHTGPVEAIGKWIGFRPRQIQLVAGPLYHNAPFTWSYYGLFDDHQLIVMDRFDAARAVDLIERYRVSWGFLVPTMMRRIAQLPGIQSRDFSSIAGIYHSGASCPAWLRQAWIELIGGERLYEAYGATEAVGTTFIRADEWLNRKGSVGKPHNTEIKILDECGREAAVGDVGEIFMRPKTQEATYYYIGSPPAKTTEDGFISVGDLGSLDENGYLFLADRRNDLILSGGANIYPAEIEAVLSEHPDIFDVAVIGLPDEDWGQRVHAVVQLRGAKPSASVSELDAYCRERLASYKVPKSYDFVVAMPRQESGKLRRAAMAAERMDQSRWNFQKPVRSARKLNEP